MSGVRTYPKTSLFPPLASLSKYLPYLHVMKTLIIHPKDPTTTFLAGIYKNLTNKTVVTGGITKDELRKHILDHDRILMMGHGSTAGLFGVGQFNMEDTYIIDDSMVEILRDKIAIFVWCNADKFVQRHSLYGFYSGMFLSQEDEAIYYNFWNLNDLERLINESNYEFSSILSKHLDEGLYAMFKNVVAEYGLIAKYNPISRFNLDRLYLNLPTQPMMSGKDFNITHYNLQHGCN